MSRLKRPLNSGACAAADEELYRRHENDPRPNALFDAEGKRLKLSADDPAQADLRAEWRTLYLANGGKLEGDDPVDSEPDDPAEPCPEAGPVPDPCASHSIQITLDADHFAPEAEELVIHYTITGPIGEVESIKLLVVTEEKPDGRILEKAIDSPYEQSGTIPWNGEVTAGGFQGYANLASSPYVLQLVMKTTNCPACESNTEKVKVLPLEIEIRVEDPSGTGSDVVETLKTEMAADNGKGRVLLNSPVFKIRSDEMKDDASFRKYRSHSRYGEWIPLLAKVWLKGKTGDKKRSAKAVAGTKILWDYKYDDDAAYETSLGDRGVHNEAKTFQKKVSAHKKDNSEPKGRTAHKDFGGLRAMAAELSGSEKRWKSLQGSWGHSDPAQRKWAGYTVCGVAGGVDAESGVSFLSGRMAGDVHHFTAYIDLDGSLDATGDGPLDGAPAEQKSNTLTATVWREIHVVKNYKIGASTSELDIPALDKEYTKAAMTIKAKPGLAVEEIQATWKGHYQTVITAMGSSTDFVKHAAEDDPKLYPVYYRSFWDYMKLAEPDKGFWGRLWTRIQCFFGASDDDDYRKECDKYAYRIYIKVVKKFPLENNGLTFYKFGADGDHNRWKSSYTAGIAPGITG